MGGQCDRKPGKDDSKLWSFPSCWGWIPNFVEYKSKTQSKIGRTTHYKIKTLNWLWKVYTLQHGAWALQLVFPVGPLRQKKLISKGLGKSKSWFLLDLNTVLPSKNVKQEILSSDFVAYWGGFQTKKTKIPKARILMDVLFWSVIIVYLLTSLCSPHCADLSDLKWFQSDASNTTKNHTKFQNVQQ